MGAVNSMLRDLLTDAQPYPVEFLPAGGTSLSLFAAGFLGTNDSIHFADQGLTGTCVDTDDHRLKEMASIYPDTWTFVTQDAWEYATAMLGHKWDVVSVDTFTGRATDKSIRDLALWCSLAKRLVTVTLPSFREQRLSVPNGWRAETIFPRSSIASWLVLVHA